MNKMVKTITTIKYECEKCGLRFPEGSEIQAQEHEAIPVDTPLPKGFVFGNCVDDVRDLGYFVVELIGKIRQSHAISHSVQAYAKNEVERWDRQFGLLMDSTSIKEGIKSNEYRFLSKEEFREFNSQYEGDSKLIRTIPRLETICEENNS